MNALPAALPRHPVPVCRREPGVAGVFLILRRAGIAAHQAAERNIEQARQRQLLEPPDIVTGHSVRQRQVVRLSQQRAGVNSAGHTVDADPHVRVPVPDRPQDGRRPAVLRQR